MMLTIAKSVQAKRAGKGTVVLDILAKERWVLPLALIVIYVIAFSAAHTDVFLSESNLAALLLEFSIPSIVVIGMALLIISGEIDLSVGYNIMFSNVVAGTLVILGVPVIAALLITLAVAGLFGLIVGLLVARVGVNSFIATLGLGLAYYGLTQFLYNLIFSVDFGEYDIQHLPEAFVAIGQTTVIGVKLPVLFALVLLIVFSVLMAKSRYFRKYYYIGMNKDAADLSGINVARMKTVAFVLSALLAAFAGALLAARMGSSSASFGKGWELKSITAVVLGGVSFKGGVGTLGGAILGSLFMICLSNGLRIAEVPSDLYKIIEGLVLLAAVILDAQLSRRKVIG
jgi:ribose transport system permease protein